VRGLALVAAAHDRPSEAVAHYERARALAPRSRELVTEELDLLLADGRPAECLEIVAGLPDDVRRHGRTRLLEAQALSRLGLAARAGAILDDLEVEDLAEGDAVVGELWAQVHPGRPIPPRLDFRMADVGNRR